MIVPRKSHAAAAEPSSASLISSSCPVSFPSSSHTAVPQSSSSTLSASVLPARSAHSYNNLLKVDASKLSEPRVGADFQAIIPPPPATTNQKRDTGGATTNQKRDTGGADAETMMWSPRWAEDLPPNQLEEYLRVCSSAAAGGGGLSTEEALRILGSCHSNVFQVVPEYGTVYTVPLWIWSDLEFFVCGLVGSDRQKSFRIKLYILPAVYTVYFN